MEWDWARGLLGGLMIGSAAALYLLANGRIMGASGIFGGALDGSTQGTERHERLAFLAGLILCPAIIVALGAAEASRPVAGTLGLIVAGLLVGLGTRMANGCTSGHGVCGISRLARRGLVATAVYLVFGVLGVLIAHALGLGL